MAEYVGKKSCAYRKEGWYVVRAPKRLEYYAALLWASLRDYRRRYKYDDLKGCKKVRCGIICFEKKILFIKNTLAPRYLSGSKLKKVQKWCDYVLKYKKLPAEVKKLYKKAIRKR